MSTPRATEDILIKTDEAWWKTRNPVATWWQTWWRQMTTDETKWKLMIAQDNAWACSWCWLFVAEFVVDPRSFILMLQHTTLAQNFGNQSFASTWRRLLSTCHSSCDPYSPRLSFDDDGHHDDDADDCSFFLAVIRTLLWALAWCAFRALWLAQMVAQMIAQARAAIGFRRASTFVIWLSLKFQGLCRSCRFDLFKHTANGIVASPCLQVSSVGLACGPSGQAPGFLLFSIYGLSWQ